MPIPPYLEFMLPFLQLAADGREHAAGSLEGNRASKGVLITTSTFSSEALDYVKKIGKTIVLIEGQLLAQLMIDHNVGVEDGRSFILKKIDHEYFDED